MNNRIVQIPREYFSDFKNDPIVAWQSYGDSPQESEFPYFENRQAVHAMVDPTRINPINDQTLEIDTSFKCDRLDTNYRFIHIDYGLVRDSCGISMCYVSDWVKVLVRKPGEGGKSYVAPELLPEFTFDFILQITPESQGGEIIFSDVRKIIYELNNRGFPILLITFDRFQSEDTIQILKRDGFICGHVSLDRTSTYPVIDSSKPDKIAIKSTNGKTLSAWNCGKVAVNSGRVKVPYYKPVSDTSVYDYDVHKGDVDDLGKRLDSKESITLIEQEAYGATYDAKAKKVLEPPGGTIDLLESVMGSVFVATMNVTEYIIEETGLDKRVRHLCEMARAESEFERQDIASSMGESDIGGEMGGSIFEEEDMGDSF